MQWHWRQRRTCGTRLQSWSSLPPFSSSMSCSWICSLHRSGCHAHESITALLESSLRLIWNAQTVCGFRNNPDLMYSRCQAPSRQSKMMRISCFADHVLGNDGSLRRSTCDQLCPLPLLSKWCCIPDSLHFEAEQMISKASWPWWTRKALTDCIFWADCHGLQCMALFWA